VRVGYLIDTNVVGDHRRPLSPAATAAAMEAMIAEGVLAERSGFHSVHVPDRHRVGACVFPAPEQLLTLIARETERVMLGSFTFVATLVHPMKAAEQFAVIDNLSGGRLVTTVSRGFLPAFWDQFGVPQERMLGRFMETLRIWEAAFSGAPVDFDGDHWQVRDGRLAPAPAQPHGWPLWGGGNKVPAAVRRSADYADAWTCDPLPASREAFAADVGLYRERAAELGKRPFVVLMRDGWVADTLEEAAGVFGEHYARMVRFYVRNEGLGRNPGFASAADVTAATVVPYVLMGPAQQCIEQLEQLHEEQGVDYVVFCCRLSTGPSLEAAAEQIQRFGEEVVRPIHARYPAPDHPAIPPACRW
jgi:alkanesulfonate monooxygenase SsuD/methylene tetrahydromethanopterin reductase-like flavin-dependent oxidoreductase (luciferase family)